MDRETELEFKALKLQGNDHAISLGKVADAVEEIKESVHGQAMAIRDVSSQRALCRAEMEGKLKGSVDLADEAKKTAETAHRRIDGLTKTAWGLAAAVLLEFLAVVLWLIKLAITSGKGAP